MENGDVGEGAKCPEERRCIAYFSDKRRPCGGIPNRLESSSAAHGLAAVVTGHAGAAVGGHTVSADRRVTCCTLL